MIKYLLNIKQHVLVLLSATLLIVIHANGQENNGMRLSTLKNDTVLINQYIDSSANAKSSDSCLRFLNMAYIIAKNHNLNPQKGHVWALIATANAVKGNYTECKLYLDSAFRLGEQLNDGTLICNLHLIAAFMYQYSSDYAKASTHYFR